MTIAEIGLNGEPLPFPFGAEVEMKLAPSQHGRLPNFVALVLVHSPRCI